MTQSDYATCPGCDAELPGTWCDACETHVSDWSTVTLAEWRANNPEIVAADRARFSPEWRAFLEGCDEQLTETHGDPLLRRAA
jgi:hypothetical protein